MCLIRWHLELAVGTDLRSPNILMKPLLIGILFSLSCILSKAERDPIRLTHGPMLGHVTGDSVRVWARTSDPGEFHVRYGTSEDQLISTSAAGKTLLEQRQHRNH